MEEFRKGATRVLITTDVWARGLDVQQARAAGHPLPPPARPPLPAAVPVAIACPRLPARPRLRRASPPRPIVAPGLANGCCGASGSQAR